MIRPLIFPAFDTLVKAGWLVYDKSILRGNILAFNIQSAGSGLADIPVVPLETEAQPFAGGDVHVFEGVLYIGHGDHFHGIERGGEQVEIACVPDGRFEDCAHGFARDDRGLEIVVQLPHFALAFDKIMVLAINEKPAYHIPQVVHPVVFE